jgi:hypothetical protein
MALQAMKKTASLTETVLTEGDSKEVLSAYYAGKLMQLEYSLNQYTILDNPVQIGVLCREIIAVKSKIFKLGFVPAAGNRY